MKFRKAYSLIFMLILAGIFLCQDFAYALRAPLSMDETIKDIDLINKLSSDNVKEIDKALIELDKISEFDRDRVARIAEKVFANRGLRLKIEPNWIDIINTENNEVVGYRTFDDWNSGDNSGALLLLHAEIYDKYSDLRGKRLFPLLYRWMPAQPEFLKYSGSEIISGTPVNHNAARALWRSGFKDIKIRQIFADRGIEHIDEIKDGEFYKVSARFPMRKPQPARQELSRLLYGLDSPGIKELLTDLMAFGYGQFGVEHSEVEKIISILYDNRNNLTKARQALYDAGFNWIAEGNRYHDIYVSYKAAIRYNTTFTLIREYIDKDDVIADVGCGDDKLGRIITEEISGTSIIGMDVVDYRGPDYKGHKNVDFILQTDSNKIPLPDHSVDKVLFSAVFHHASPETADNLLTEARRVLKPDGEAIIIEDVVLESTNPRYNEEGLVDKFKSLTDEERKSVIAIFDWHANHVVVGETKIPMGLNYQSEEEWDQTFNRAGFKVETKDFIGIYRDKFHAHPHTVFVLRSPAIDQNALSGESRTGL